MTPTEMGGNFGSLIVSLFAISVGVSLGIKYFKKRKLTLQKGRTKNGI